MYFVLIKYVPVIVLNAESSLMNCSLHQQLADSTKPREGSGREREQLSSLYIQYT